MNVSYGRRMLCPIMKQPPIQSFTIMPSFIHWSSWHHFICSELFHQVSTISFPLSALVQSLPYYQLVPSDERLTRCRLVKLNKKIKHPKNLPTSIQLFI